MFNPTEVKLFRQILFWPLRLIPSQDKDPSREDFAKTLQGQLTGSPWQKHEDLYDRGTASDEITRYAEFVYFHPFIRQFLYGRKGENHDSVLQLFRRDDVKQVEVVLRNDETYQFKVERLHLYAFDIKVAILVMEISSLKPLYLVEVQDFLDQFRRVYPPYWNSNHQAGNSPKTVTLWGGNQQPLATSVYDESDELLAFVRNHKESPIVKHWRFLLEPLCLDSPDEDNKNKICFRQIEDDRIPYMAYLAFESDPRSSLSYGDMMRLTFVEGSGHSDTLPYSSQFAEYFERNYCYDPYWDTNPEYYQKDQEQNKHGGMSTRYLCCGYAFTMIGKDDPSFFSNDKAGLLAHFRHHYFQIGLIANLNKATLLVQWEDLTKAVADFSGSSQPRQVSQEKISEVLKNLLRLTHRYWFTELSNQMQAKQLFDWWSEHLGNRKLFDQVMKEAQDAYQYLEMAEQRHQTKVQQHQTEMTVRLTVLATIGLVVGLTLSLLGMNNPSDLWGFGRAGVGISFVVLIIFLAGGVLTLRFSKTLSRWIDKLAK